MTIYRYFGSAMIVLALSGCATERVQKLPDSPGMERVTRKECAVPFYPFYFTGNVLAAPYGKGFIKSDTAPQEGDRWAGVVASIFLTPVTLVIDGVFMPFELFGPAFPKCDSTVVDRPVAGYPHIDDIPTKKISRHSLLTLHGEGFNNHMLVRFGDVKTYPEAATETMARIRVPDSLPFGERSISVENSVGQSDQQLLSIIPAKPPILKIENPAFVDDNKDGQLSAGEKGAITFTVTNRLGAGEEVGLVARPQVVPSAEINTQGMYIGEIEGGSRADVRIPLTASLDTPTGKATVTVTFEDTTGFPPDPVSVRFETRKLAVPELVVADVTMDDRFYPDRKDKLSVGNGDGIIQPGEQVEIAAKLVNHGGGVFSQPKISAHCETPGATLVTSPELAAGSILPGKWTDFGFVLSLRKDFTAPDVRIELHIEDGKVGRFNTSIVMALTVGKAFPSVTFREVKGHPASSKKVEMPSFGEELLPPPHATKANPDAVAVIIGVQNYKNLDVPSVDYALNDAEVVEEYVVKAMGVSPENVILARDASKGDLERIYQVGNSRALLAGVHHSRPVVSSLRG